MNGELLKLVMEAAPGVAETIRSMKKQPKDQEMLVLLTAQLIKASNEGFRELSVKFDLQAKMLSYVRDGIEGLAKQAAERK